jgi:hypothetical protein
MAPDVDRAITAREQKEQQERQTKALERIANYLDWLAHDRPTDWGGEKTP